MATLRGYQGEFNRNIRSEWARMRYEQTGRVVMGVLPTGGGKTVCMGDLATHHDGYGCAIAHRSELVGQISTALAKEGIVHSIVAAEKTWKAIQRAHYDDFGKSFINQNRSEWTVASVDTIIKRQSDPIFKRATMAIEDEGHHALRNNKWGKVFGMFSATCLGLLLTATPIRTDGSGLGSSFDGIADCMVEGPAMRWMIDNGYLTDYDVLCPSVEGLDLDLERIKTTASGEMSPEQLADLMRKHPQIVGDVVKHYLEFARGKLGITFAVNIEEARKIAAEFNRCGVPALVVSSESTDDERRNALKLFARREILQLVNVDLFGEGFDLPAIEVVSMARPTASVSLFYQQWGRALRLMISPILMAAWDTYTPAQRLAFIAASEKPKALIIDHVGNLLRHKGPPDKQRVWTLASVSRARGASDEIPLKSCHYCHKPFQRVLSKCPYPMCGKVQPPPDPSLRGGPKTVDGMLDFVSPEKLAELRRGAAAVDRPIRPPQSLEGNGPALYRLQQNHAARQRAQQNLRHTIACWAGLHPGADNRENEARFFHTFGVDVLTACGLDTASTNELRAKIARKMLLAGAIINGLPFPEDATPPQQDNAA